MDFYSWDDRRDAAPSSPAGGPVPTTSNTRQPAPGPLTGLSSSLSPAGAPTPSPLGGDLWAGPGGAATPAPADAKPTVMPGVSGIVGLPTLGGPQGPAAPTGAPPAPPQPQTAGRLVKPTFGGTPGAGALDALSQQAQQLQSITDPQQRAVAQDQIARGVAAALQQAGHTVKWNVDQLIVDGRPYVIGGTPAAGASGAADQRPPAGPELPPIAPTPNTPPGAELPPIAPTPNTPTPNAPGPPPAAGTIDPQQAYAQVVARFGQKFQGRQMSPQEFEALKQIVGFDPSAPVTQDMLDRAFQFIDQYTGDINNPWGPASGGPGAPPPGQPGVGTPEWRAGYQGYNPGEVPFDDLEGMDVGDILSRLGTMPEAGQLSTDPRTEAMVNGLLDNPYTFDQQTVDTLKARSKDELAEMGAMNDAELRNFGFDTGITDSNWLASERNAARRDTDRAIVSGNRDIDILKAQTDVDDRRKAAALGMEFSDRRFDQVLKSQAERRQSVQLAADTSLRSSALRGDRLALREQINAKAAELGLDADRMQLQYTLGLMDDLTKRYGIDVSKDLDLKKLASADRQFNEELALRFAQLEFQYAELMKRDDWAQLNAGVQLAGYGFSGEPDGGWTGGESNYGGPNAPWDN